MKLLSILYFLSHLVTSVFSTAGSAGLFNPSSLSPQHTYCYFDTQYASDVAPVCDWNITLIDPLTIFKNVSSGIFWMSTNYTIDDHHYDMELFEKDCKTAPTGPTNLPLEFQYANNNASSVTFKNDFELVYQYNQTMIQDSSLWTAYGNGQGGEAEFCMRLNVYLGEPTPTTAFGVPFNDFFYLQINFLEVVYKVVVDSLTDFDTNVDIIRLDETDGGVKEINYEEDIEAYTCDDSYNTITEVYNQGDYVNICVKTVDESKFGVHSVKELVFGQVFLNGTTYSEYPYVSDFIDSPLASSGCKDSNTTDAICKSKVQLISAWFDDDMMVLSGEELEVFGVVKLDYVGRRLNVDVPVNIRVGGAANNVDDRRKLETIEVPGDSFTLQLKLSSDRSVESMGRYFLSGLFSTAVASVAGLFTALF